MPPFRFPVSALEFALFPFAPLWLWSFVFGHFYGFTALYLGVHSTLEPRASRANIKRIARSGSRDGNLPFNTGQECLYGYHPAPPHPPAVSKDQRVVSFRRCSGTRYFVSSPSLRVGGVACGLTLSAVGEHLERGPLAARDVREECALRHAARVLAIHVPERLGHDLSGHVAMPRASLAQVAE